MIILGSPTCEDPGYEAEYVKEEVSSTNKQVVTQTSENLKQSIENDFEARDLTQQKRQAFEERAKQKLLDFTEYLTLFASKELDTAFRYQAWQMVTDLFVNEEIKINMNFTGHDPEGSYSLPGLREKIQSSAFSPIGLDIENISVTDPSKPVEEGEYKGSLGFTWHVWGIESSDTILISSAEGNIDFYIKKVVKHFGNDSRQVWNVFFGDSY
jgi:hypothetical protein